ncbi:hypothetical protein C8J57DRAFT_1231803 [Mycena rebaudengoi]|nr:hypothetical protein C8J57DRAFT_1231803 [Mycena rebaudengoi]
MRFTAVATLLVTITAAYAGTIEIRQGCPGTKVCPTNTVLQCCKGINLHSTCVFNVPWPAKLACKTLLHRRKDLPQWNLSSNFLIHTCGELNLRKIYIFSRVPAAKLPGILIGVGKYTAPALSVKPQAPC